MTITIMPDPQRPHGGGAILRLTDTAPLGNETTVSVFDRSRERWLGDKAWQPAPARFGPYPVQMSADGAQEVAVGSEIVDHIDEYAPLRLEVGEAIDNVDWPDTIMYAPGAPPRGWIVGAEDADEPGLTETFPNDENTTPNDINATGQDDDTIQPGPIDDETRGTHPETGGSYPKGPDTGDQPLAETEPGKPSGNGRMILFAGLGLLVIAAAILVVLMTRDTGPPPTTGDDPDTQTQTETDPEPPAEDLCSPEALAQLTAPFADSLSRLRDCGPDVDANAALQLLERAATANDPQGLLAFGHLYDADVTIPGIEEDIGLGFSDRPDIAARYYARARDAGAEEASTALQTVCDRIALSDDALIMETAAEYCE